MSRNICLAAVAAVGVAVAEDLPWRFDGDVARDPASAAAGSAAVSAPALRVKHEGNPLPDDFDSALGFSSRASDPMPVFDSDQRPGAVIIIR